MRYLYCLLTLFCFAPRPSGAQTFWDQTNGPSGLRAHSVAVAPNGTLFVASNKIFRSSDHGASWQAVCPELRNQFSLLMALNGDDHVYVATKSRGNIGDPETSDFWSSSDAGDSWQLTVMAPIAALHVSRWGTLYVGLRSGVVLSSTNNGATWDTTVTNLTGIINTIFSDVVGHLFVNAQYLYRSLDSGKSFGKVVNGIVGKMLCSGSGASDSGVYAVDDYKVVKSMDGGRTWTPVNSDHDHLITSVAAGRNGSLFSYGMFAFVSRNGGLSWTKLSTQAFTPYYYEDFSYYNTRAFADSNGGFYITSAPGLSYLSSNNVLTYIPLPNDTVPAVLVHPHGEMIALSNWEKSYSAKPAIWISSDRGATWKVNADPSIAESTPTAIGIDSVGTILLGASGSLYLSTDIGSTWVRNASQLTSGSITAIASDANGHIFTATSSEGVFSSTDHGATWDQLATGLSDQRIFSLAVAPNGDLYAGAYAKVFRLQAMSSMWETPSIAFGSAAGAVRAISVNASGEIFIAVQGDGVWRSADISLNWERVADGLPNSSEVNALFSTPSGKTFLALDSGIYLLPSSGSTWTPVLDNANQGQVISLAYDKDGHVYAGTNGNGIYRSVDTYSSTQVKHVRVATRDGGFEVWPNPASASFHLRSRTPVHNASLLDMIGRVVRTWYPEGDAADLEWRVSDISPANYFLRLETADDVQSLPVVISH